MKAYQNLVITGSLNVSGTLLLNGEPIGSSSAAGTSLIISSSAPTSQSVGTLWFNTQNDNANGGDLFVQMQDPIGNSWVPVMDNITAYSISSSYTDSSSIALSSSVSISSSFASFAHSASFATTASSITTLNQPVVISGSFTVFTGSNAELRVTDTGVTLGNTLTDRHSITGSVQVSGSITGSLFGTSSFATSASQAISSSFLIGRTPIYLSVNKNSVQSIPWNTETTITNWDGSLINNTPSAWNATTGIWTCPVAGIYDISLTLMLSNANPDAVFNEFAPIISFNGVPYIGDWWATYTNITCNTPSITSRYVLQLTVGDVIRPRVYQNLRNNTAYNIVTGRNSFVINQLPNRIS
jgi:hypothetical protein